MIIIFHKEQPIGRLLIERDTKGPKHVITIKRNGKQIFEDEDFSLREIENEKETTYMQDFMGEEKEVMTLLTPPQ